MKIKQFIFAFFLTIVSVSFVHADTLELSSYSEDYETNINFYLTHQLEIDNLIEMWETNLSMQYPYYYIRPVLFNNGTFDIYLNYSTTSDIIYTPVLGASNSLYSFTTLATTFKTPENYWQLKDTIRYRSADDTYTIYSASNPIDSYNSSAMFYLYFGSSTGIDKSLPLINNGIKYTVNTSSYDEIQFNGFTSSTYNQVIDTFIVEEGDLMPDLVSLYDGTYTPEDTQTYQEVDLNNYSYVILSLKSYTPISSDYKTKIYTLGSLCITPVYDYGMKEKKEYYSGYQVQGCSDYYTSYTPVNFYILPADVSNHAVYYIKSSNTYVSNSIKYDTDIFNITYVNSENEDNPSVSILGRNYPTIPYDDLTDTAIISTENGYISGLSCSLGDVNCYYSSTGIDINDLFTNPLSLLRQIWTSITGVLAVVSTFILILPPVLQAFLFTAFMIGILLGLIKILI